MLVRSARQGFVCIGAAWSVCLSPGARDEARNQTPDMYCTVGYVFKVWRFSLACLLFSCLAWSTDRPISIQKLHNDKRCSRVASQRDAVATDITTGPKCWPG
ncbi:hypothetical protein B0T10DRAFT_491890 [Thelonectria olida]|uniref:Uncharacterized protein n=1 Tax=Thelonectria olida TaxID=1576542 RepID=A0A9P8W0E3_9HYPO|nr:hypothetical protein B0T10DRAFT_491890 [Thelonectria olida]